MPINVSIIIPVYNSAALLSRCLDSIFSQTYAGKKEIILIDDGSTDHSLDIVKSRSENSIVLVSQQNKGPAAARNRGIALAKGEYIALIDSDDYWEPQFLDTTISFIRSHPEAVAVSVGQRHKTLSGESILPSCIQNGTAGKSRMLPDFFSFWANQNHVCTGSVLMKRETVLLTGGQRSDLRVCEDLEFWVNLAMKGSWGFIPQVLFTSDGMNVTRSQGWLAKMEQRWGSATTIEEWEKRIVSKQNSPLPPDYEQARGRIASILCYCLLLSGRTRLARQQALAHAASFPAGRKRQLIIMASATPFTWTLLCAAFRFRERHRKI